ncbi:MAG TPA: UDP-N-acetylmuramate dehydrogenase [Vicinamibacterales bacterium]
MTDTPVREHAPLAGLTTLGVGGPARWFATAARVEDVRFADDWCRARGVPLWVLGGGSNVVVSDEGFAGMVLRIGITGWRSDPRQDELIVDVGAGDTWDSAVGRLVDDGWAGVECLSGIPGTVGGTPIQNVGAYGQEVAAVVDAVHAFDRQERRLTELPAAECAFAYRHSRFKGVDAGRFVICGVRFRVRRGAPTVTYPDVQRWLADQAVGSPAVTDVRRAVLAIRRTKGMVLDAADADTWSVGSFFMNPVVSEDVRRRLDQLAPGPIPARPAGNEGWRVPAAWLIQQAGWTRGDGEGPVGLSSKHPLAIVNRGGARAADVIRFAARVKRGVADACGVWLLPEPVFVGFGPDSDLEYLRKAQP